MLKITLHDSPEELRFHLKGVLAGLWVTELRQCWKTASSTTEGRRTVADLRDLKSADEDGEALLREMSMAGVALVNARAAGREVMRAG
jgi:hypothetical protein